MALLATSALNNKLTCPQQTPMIRLEQRGPGRISAARDIRPSLATSKLRTSSSIAKVVAVSRNSSKSVVQPVASSTISAGKRTVPVVRQAVRQVTASELVAKTRPSSLALNSSSKNTSTSSRHQISTAKTLLKNASDVSSSKTSPVNKHSTSIAKAVTYKQNLTLKVKRIQAKQANANHEPRSNTSLKKPTLVVGCSRQLLPPQSPAQRSNSNPPNLMTKTQVSANKISATATTNPATTVMHISYETGKVNKDATYTGTKTNDNSALKERRTESKQDGISGGDEMVIAAPRRLPPTATINGLASTSTRNLANNGYTSKGPPNIAGRKKIAASASAPSKSFDGSNQCSLIGSEKINQHPLLASSDANCFETRLLDKQLSSNSGAGHTLLSTMSLSQQLQQQQQHQGQVHDCLGATESVCGKSLAPHSNRGGKSSCETTISNLIQSKPMGQQVLSLMMLDVGLLPATHDHSNLHKASPQKRNHVRLHQHSEQDVEKLETDALSCSSLDSNWSRLTTYGLTQKKDEDVHNSGIGLCCSAINPSSIPTHQTLRLRLPFENPQYQKSRSISLPTSPCLKLHSSLHSSQFNRDSRKLFLFKQNNSATNLNNTFDTSHSNEKQASTNISPLSHNLLSCNNQTSDSISSSCSSLTLNPPSLTLPNGYQHLAKHLKLNTSTADVTHAEKSTYKSEQYKTHLWDQAQVIKQHEQLTTDLNLKIEKYQSDEVYSEEKADAAYGNLNQTSNPNSHQLSPQLGIPFSSNRLTSAVELDIQQHQSVVHQHSERQAQQRSLSISENGYHLNAQFHRLKQPVYVNGNSNNNNNQRLVDNYKSYGFHHPGQQAYQIPPNHQQLNQFQRRPASPLDAHLASSYREAPMALPSEDLTRNQMHASLECLNASYAEYQHQEMKKIHDQRHQLEYQQAQQQHILLQQQQQQQQQKIRNQHYASSYVLVAPPVNTIINQNGDQDLAAAAMDTSQSSSLSSSSQYKSTGIPIGVSGHNSGANQSLINRAFGQMMSSPYRRLNNCATPGGLSQGALSNLHHPIRAGHSSLSLASSSFILEDKLQNEIRKLQAELKTEIEKNDALNSQLNINSSLMSAFEQSLTTLNTRLRQLTTLNEKKDTEIEELREQIKLIQMNSQQEILKDTSMDELKMSNYSDKDWSIQCDMESSKGATEELLGTIKELKRQLLEKDRLLTDTRLEALSAAHQLEQLESKMNGDHSLVANEDEVEDEGVMIVNHSPSDSEAVTDSVNLSEINCRVNKSNEEKKYQPQNWECESTPINSADANHKSNEQSSPDDQNSNHSSDLYSESREEVQPCTNNDDDSGVMCKLLDNLIVSN